MIYLALNTYRLNSNTYVFIYIYIIKNLAMVFRALRRRNLSKIPCKIFYVKKFAIVAQSLKLFCTLYLL